MLHTSVLLFVAILGSDFVKLLYLLNRLVIQRNNILTADVGCSISFEKQKLVADDAQTVKNLSFPSILRKRYRRCIHRCRLSSKSDAQV